MGSLGSMVPETGLARCDGVPGWQAGTCRSRVPPSSRPAQRAFARWRQLLDRVFGAARGGAVGMLEACEQAQRRMRARITRALARDMFGVAALDVGGDARVEAAVAAFDQIDVPAGHATSLVAAATTPDDRCRHDDGTSTRLRASCGKESSGQDANPARLNTLLLRRRCGRSTSAGPSRAPPRR